MSYLEADTRKCSVIIKMIKLMNQMYKCSGVLLMAPALTWEKSSDLGP